MTHEERLDFLLTELLIELYPDKKVLLPDSITKKKELLRGLMNIRMPLKSLSEDFFKIQDEYLKKENYDRGITDIEKLSPICDGIYLWKGDITTLNADAIVNAANSKMLGCFVPGHHCIDNAIHSFAGIQLRTYCNEIMEKQGYDEPVGRSKITPAYNLPCRYIIHTVGPIVDDSLTEEHCLLLSSCYNSCLQTALENNIKSIAFCCISTGEFHFPNKQAADIAVKTVKEFKKRVQSNIKIIFNVFKELDWNIYKNLL